MAQIDYEKDITGELRRVSYSQLYCCLQECLTKLYTHLDLTQKNIIIGGTQYTRIPFIKVRHGDLYSNSKEIDAFFTTKDQGSIMVICKINSVASQLTTTSNNVVGGKIQQQTTDNLVIAFTLNIISQAGNMVIDNTTGEGYIRPDYASYVVRAFNTVFDPQIYGDIHSKYNIAFNRDIVCQNENELGLQDNLYRYIIHNQARTIETINFNNVLDKVDNIDVNLTVNK